MLQMMTLGWFRVPPDHGFEHRQGSIQDVLVLHHSLFTKPLDAPPVDRQLFQEQDAQPVAEGEELGCLRIVRADQVDPGLLHQPELVLDERVRRIRAEAAVFIVSVDAPDLQWPAVQEELPALRRDRPDPERRCHPVDLPTLRRSRVAIRV